MKDSIPSFAELVRGHPMAHPPRPIHLAPMPPHMPPHMPHMPLQTLQHGPYPPFLHSPNPVHPMRLLSASPVSRLALTLALLAPRLPQPRKFDKIKIESMLDDPPPQAQSQLNLVLSMNRQLDENIARLALGDVSQLELARLANHYRTAARLLGLVEPKKRKRGKVCKPERIDLDRVLFVVRPETAFNPLLNANAKCETNILNTDLSLRTDTKCTQCGLVLTPEWRLGPHGSRTLCNACGLFFLKLIKKFGTDGASAKFHRLKQLGKVLDRRIGAV